MSGRLAVALFSGGRGGASIARGLLHTPGVDLTLVINGYDNGRSTGALRRYLPGMLGPSDFRKNLLVHLDGRDPRQAALRSVLEHRLPAGTTRADLADLAGLIADPPARPRDGAAREFAALPPPAREAITRDLAAVRARFDSHPGGLDLTDCALGNLVLAGAYLRLGEDFNAAVRACARTFETPIALLNVTNGENAYLAALKQDGRLLADEADIVAPQDAAAITDLFLLREPVSAACQAELEGRPAEEVRLALECHRAEISLNPAVWDAIRDADLLLYGPGTPHSSLLPSYLTPGIADAIAESRAAAKVFVVNTRDDHDVQGLSAPELVGRTLHYLGDPGNDRGTVTHVLSHCAPNAPHAPTVPPYLSGGGVWAGARWVTADLEDAERPGAHCGARTVRALTSIAGAAAPARA